MAPPPSPSTKKRGIRFSQWTNEKQPPKKIDYAAVEAKKREMKFKVPLTSRLSHEIHTSQEECEREFSFPQPILQLSPRPESPSILVPTLADLKVDSPQIPSQFTTPLQFFPPTMHPGMPYFVVFNPWTGIPTVVYSPPQPSPINIPEPPFPQPSPPPQTTQVPPTKSYAAPAMNWAQNCCENTAANAPETACEPPHEECLTDFQNLESLDHDVLQILFSNENIFTPTGKEELPALFGSDLLAEVEATNLIPNPNACNLNKKRDLDGAFEKSPKNRRV